jgi:uncharacterized protein (AIM24 family)
MARTVVDLQYELSGEDQQCLQVIIQPNDSILVNCHTICWMSDQIAVEKLDTFFSALFGNRTENLRLTNLSEPVKFVGLAQKQSGRIFVMKNKNAPRGLYFFKDIFICAHGIPEIPLRQFPDQGMAYRRSLTSSSSSSSFQVVREICT